MGWLVTFWAQNFIFLKHTIIKQFSVLPWFYPNHPTIASMQCFYGLLDFATIGDTSSIPTYSALRSNATRSLRVFISAVGPLSRIKPRSFSVVRLGEDTVVSTSLATRKHFVERLHCAPRDRLSTTFASIKSVGTR
jgi:hypothetical protein